MRPVSAPDGGIGGASSEVIFAGAGLVGSIDAAGSGPEADRRDASLAMREPPTLFALDAWPEAPRPTLAYPRRITLPRQAETVLIFREGRGYGRHLYRDGGYHQSSGHGGHGW